jgi:hypothetical protein
MSGLAHGSAVGSNDLSTLIYQIPSDAEARVMQSPGRAEGWKRGSYFLQHFSRLHKTRPIGKGSGTFFRGQTASAAPNVWYHEKRYLTPVVQPISADG